MIYSILERHPEGRGRVFRGVVFFMSITCIRHFSWECDWEEIRVHTGATTLPVFLSLSLFAVSRSVWLLSHLQVISMSL